MANLDPRLFDLIETLVAARLDWLAFEVVEGVRLGRPVQESEAELAAARDSIRENSQPVARGEPQKFIEETASIAVEEQVRWAAAYVDQRLDAAVAQLEASLESLDEIVRTTPQTDGVRAQTDASVAAEDHGAILVLRDGEVDRKSRREDVAGAREDIATLRIALAAWIAQSDGQATI